MATQSSHTHPDNRTGAGWPSDWVSFCAHLDVYYSVESSWQAVQCANLSTLHNCWYIYRRRIHSPANCYRHRKIPRHSETISASPSSTENLVHYSSLNLGFLCCSVFTTAFAVWNGLAGAIHHSYSKCLFLHSSVDHYHCLRQHFCGCYEKEKITEPKSDTNVFR